MEIKTIKGVDEGTWIKFKILAARKRLPMGKLLNAMINEYEKSSDEFWSKILNSGKILSEKEGKDIAEMTSKLRKEGGFRNASDF